MIYCLIAARTTTPRTYNYQVLARQVISHRTTRLPSLHVSRSIHKAWSMPLELHLPTFHFLLHLLALIGLLNDEANAQNVRRERGLYTSAMSSLCGSGLRIAAQASNDWLHRANDWSAMITMAFTDRRWESGLAAAESLPSDHPKSAERRRTPRLAVSHYL